MFITVIIIALLLDKVFGEPRRFHPLVGFGNLVIYFEKRLNPHHVSTRKSSRLKQFIMGWLAVTLLVLPLISLTALLGNSLNSYSLNSYSAVSLFIIESLILYCAIGNQSLKQHSMRVHQALITNDLPAAKHHVSMIVSRDTDEMNDTQIAQATIETTLENGNDAVFGAIFWYCLGGSVGVVAYRLMNTLDAMWGYRTPRFLNFGKTAARLDDALNYIPARLTALSYALAGKFSNNIKRAFKCWREQANLLNSPNGGPVMTSGAGSLNIQLGGPTYYHQSLVNKPFFGGENTAKAADIKRAITLVQSSILIWLTCLALGWVTVRLIS